MSGRGRPRKLKSTETNNNTPENRELPSPPRCPQKELVEEEQTSTKSRQTTKKKVQQKNESEVTKGQPETPSDTERKKSAKACSGRSTSLKEPTKMTKQQPKDTTRARGDITEQQTTLKDKTKDGVKRRATPAKCPAKTVNESEVTKGQPETPPDTERKKSAKACSGRSTSLEEPTKMTKQQPKDTTRAREDITEQQTTLKDKTKDGVKRRANAQMGANADMKQICPKDQKKPDAAKNQEANTLLRKTLETLTIRKKEKSEAAKVINEIEKVILTHLKGTLCFKEMKVLHTGSYYENLKISNPDEFDIMFFITVERADVIPFRDDGAYYSVRLNRGNSPLKNFQSDSEPLSASKLLNEFRDEVKKSIKNFPGVRVDRKKRGCPAVTLTINVDSSDISLDVVLCLEVKSSWPTFTEDGFQIEKWLSRKVKKEQKYKPYYLVPKYEGKGTEMDNDVAAKDVWRLSFSHIEKYILNNHGSEKKCCEQDGDRCCRKECLKLLKHLLNLLKICEDSFDKFCSYHAKTTLFHACCSRTKDSEWAAANLSDCFCLLLKDFESHLECGTLKNFFIPTQNLLYHHSRKSCTDLALRIRQEREGGFPIFKQYNTKPLDSVI